MLKINIPENWAEKPPPPRMKEKCFTLDLSHFRQFPTTLVFVAERPPKMRENFLHWIYPFQAISSNFGFCGRKVPPWIREFFFYTGSIHFRQFPTTLVFVAEKPPPPPKMRENFFTLDLSISGNFQQLWFFVAEKPPPRMREIFFTLDLSISGNFQQLWFLWQKSPHTPPPRMRKFFLHSIYPFQTISSNFGFWGRKAPPPHKGNVYIRGLLREAKDHMPGTVIVSLSSFSFLTPSISHTFMRTHTFVSRCSVQLSHIYGAS